MSIDLFGFTGGMSELCDAVGVHENNTAFLNRASTAGLPDIRQDVMDNVRNAHTTLECYSSGVTAPMSPELSLPQSLDGRFAPSARHSSISTTVESLDGWLPVRGGDQKGNQDSNKSSARTSPFALGAVTMTPNVVQGNWNRLVSISQQPQGVQDPVLLISGRGGDDSPLPPFALMGQRGRNGGQAMAGKNVTTGEDNESCPQAQGDAGSRHRKENKRRRAVEVEEDAKEIESTEHLPKDKINERATGPYANHEKCKRPNVKQDDSDGDYQRFWDCVF